MKRFVLPFMIMCAALFMSQSVSADNYTIANITSNMSPYETNTLDNLKDNDFTTKFWSSGVQTANQYILVDLGTVQPLQEINLYFASGDQPTAAKIEISNDASQYEELVRFQQGDIGGSATKYLYSCSALDKEARYIRFSLTSSASSWFQMTEFQIPIPDAKAPSRTITVSVNDASMGTAYIGTEGTVSQTAEGPIILKAVSNTGFAFTSWTINGVVVAKTADFIDNTEGDKNYVANFAPAPYDDFCTPGATTGGNKRAQSKGEILNATGVIDGSTMEFYPSGSAANQAWSNRSDMINVESGATFNLKVTYGTEGWGSLTVYQMNSSDDYTMIYGPYEGAWATDAATTTLFSNINAADDLATANASDGTVIFPITIPQDLNRGDAVVIRFIIHKTTLNGNPCATGIEELNYCDYVFYVGKGMSQIVAKAMPSSGGSVAIDDTQYGETTGVSVEEGGSATLKALPEDGYQFVGWFNEEDTKVSDEAEYALSNITESAIYTAKFEFIPVAERTITVVSSDATKGSVAITDPATTELSISSTGIVTVEATPAGSDNVFVNWTDGNGDVVSTKSSYSYDKAGDITLTANFKSYYIVTIDNSQQGGTIEVSDASGAINSGSKVLEGTALTITVSLNPGIGIETLTLNGESILIPFEQAGSYTFQLAGPTTISATYGTQKCMLTYEYSGSGYVEVWSSDTYESGVYPVSPAGDKYNMYDRIPYGNMIYIFSMPQNSAKLTSLVVNGEEYVDNEDFLEYGDIEFEVMGPVHISAQFSGEDLSGVKESMAEGISVYAVSGGINVLAENATADIYNINGMYVRSVKVDGTEFISLPAGFYAVVVNGETYKVVVK